MPATIRASSTAPQLTPAEHATIALAERGLSQRNIALALNISRSTVRSRLENARRKLAAAKEKAA